MSCESIQFAYQFTVISYCAKKCYLNVYNDDHGAITGRYPMILCHDDQRELASKLRWHGFVVDWSSQRHVTRG